MIEEMQSQLVTIVAGAVIASALLGVASVEESLGEELSLQSALDRTAALIARAGCSPDHAFSRIDLDGALRGVPDGTRSVVLLADHLRAESSQGSIVFSVEFPALALEQPLDLLGYKSLDITFDPIDEQCQAARA